MSLSSSDDTPRNEDVIIKRTNDGSSRYTLGTLREPAQFSCATYNDAVARASRYAAAFRVRAWQTDDDRRFTRIMKTQPAASR